MVALAGDHWVRADDIMEIRVTGQDGAEGAHVKVRLTWSVELQLHSVWDTVGGAQAAAMSLAATLR